MPLNTFKVTLTGKSHFMLIFLTAFIHGTELMRFGKVALQSTKISIK
jgi:hypothetical protein